MSRFPLRYARRNILIGPGGEAAALYRADTVAYPFLPTSQKWSLLHRLERFAHLAGADFADLEGAALLPRRSLPRRAGRPSRRGPRRPRGLAPLPGGPRGAAARPRVPHPRGLRGGLAVGGRWRPEALRSFGRVRRRVEELAGVGGPRPISGSELEALAAIEQRTFDRLSGAIALQRASTRELQWLLVPRRLSGRSRAGARPFLGARRAGDRGAGRLGGL